MIRYNSRTPNLCLILAIVPLLLTVSALAQGQPKTEKKQRETFSGLAAGQSGGLAGKSVLVTFIINSYSQEPEVHSLVGTLKKSGPDGLLKAIEDLDEKGRVAPTSSVGTGVEVIREVPLKNGKRRITLLTGRNITMAETRNMSRSRDYPFGLAFLEVDSKGKGTGVMYVGCKIKFNKKEQIEIESYGIAPLRLMNVYLMD
jgi:hypothetical protein